jgi:hypothetical protein
MSRRNIAILFSVLAVLLLRTTPASAQTASGSTATATANAPIYIGAEVSPTPLRVAAPGTLLRVLKREGDWVQVEFHDPQWGPRVGWVQVSLVRISNPELEPMDLSVRPQQPAAPAPRERSDAPRPQASTYFRQHIVGRSGLTFGTATAVLVGVEYSADVVPVMQVYGSFDWHHDVAPDFVKDLGDMIGSIVGAEVEYSFPAFVGVGGVKIIGPPNTVRPYGIGGFGVGRVHGTVEVDGSDVTDLLDEYGYVDKDDLSFTKPLFEVGGGVAISAGRAWIDLSYRFRKFLDVGEPVNISGVYAGAGISF